MLNASARLAWRDPSTTKLRRIFLLCICYFSPIQVNDSILFNQVNDEMLVISTMNEKYFHAVETGLDSKHVIQAV
jgi:hypothetical protein